MGLESSNFVYNGKNSTDMGVISVQTHNNSRSVTNLIGETFVANKTIVEKSAPGRTKPYYQGVSRSPIQFPLTLFFTSGFTNSDLDNVKEWLDTDTYEEFYFTDDTSRRYLCMFDSSSSLNHNGSGQGFITITMRCNDAYAYSEEYLDSVIDLSNNPASGSTISFNNQGSETLYSEMWVSKVGSGNVSITNTSNNGEMFEFVGLEDGETVYISNEDGDIVSSLDNVYRYDNFSGDLIGMVAGYNYIHISGSCQFQQRYRFKYK